jgi:predicted LPLAT superfamily acyltransferase
VIGHRIFFWTLAFLGDRIARFFLFFVATWFFCFAATARAASADYLRRLEGLRGCRLYLRVWRHFFTFGGILLDRMLFYAGKGAFTFKTDDEDRRRLEEAVAEGNGLVLVNAHFGGWSLASGLLEEVHGVTVNLVWLENEAPDLARYEERIKSRPMPRILAADREGVSLEILAALKRGEVVCFQGDRTLGAGDVEVDLLGAPCRLPGGPYMAAASAGAPVIVALSVKEGPRSYSFRALDEFRPELPRRRERSVALRAWCARYVASLEKMIREHPLQWQNFYDFWRTGDD